MPLAKKDNFTRMRPPSL